jgi:hypothetical protein
MPFVMIFAFFSWLPRSISMLLWFTIPLLTILYISKWDARLLLFAPTLSHFLGGQASLPGLIGLWGYRCNSKADNLWGGVWLAIAFLKPQLAIFPFIWTAYQWFKWIQSKRRIPRQIWSFLSTLISLYLPGFFILPDWPLQWLDTPRPLFERALAGLIPRSLLYFVPFTNVLFWLLLGILGIAIFYSLWLFNKKRFKFDQFITTGYFINPLIHDYDLIQLIPMLDNKQLRNSALLISIPGWLVILFGYQNDHLWYVFTLIAPAILIAMLYFERKNN